MADSFAPPLTPYPISEDIRGALLGLAERSDVLILGSVPGTREVPRLAVGLLPDLSVRGYGTLALEIPADRRSWLVLAGTGPGHWLPGFFHKTPGDARGSAQVVALTRAALGGYAGRWEVLCYDEAIVAQRKPGITCDYREVIQVRNLLAQRTQFCPEGKVLVLCGEGDSDLPDHAPLALADRLRQEAPGFRVHTVRVRFAGGTYYCAGSIRTVEGNSEAVPGIRPGTSDAPWELLLAESTAATFPERRSG